GVAKHAAGEHVATAHGGATVVNRDRRAPKLAACGIARRNAGSADDVLVGRNIRKVRDDRRQIVIGSASSLAAGRCRTRADALDATAAIDTRIAWRRRIAEPRRVAREENEWSFAGAV